MVPDLQTPARCSHNLAISIHRESSKERDKKREKEEKKRLELERKEQKEKEKKEQELRKKFKVRAHLLKRSAIASFWNFFVTLEENLPS